MNSATRLPVKRRLTYDEPLSEEEKVNDWLARRIASVVTVIPVHEREVDRSLEERFSTLQLNRK